MQGAIPRSARNCPFKRRSLLVPDGQNGFVGLRDPNDLVTAGLEVRIPSVAGEGKPDCQRPDHQVIVIQKRLQANILRGVGGEQIVDLLPGDGNGLFQVHGPSIARRDPVDEGSALRFLSGNTRDGRRSGSAEERAECSVKSNDIARSKKFYNALFVAIGGTPGIEDAKGRQGGPVKELQIRFS